MADNISPEQYEAAIPACCEYQGLQEHMDGLMLCWGLVAAIESDKAMICTDCGMATRTPIRIG